MGARIIVPPKYGDVKKWLIEKFGDDFEPIFLDNVVDTYFSLINTHKEYAKKRCVSYISKNIIKFDRIYRKQEILYWVKRGWTIVDAELKRIVRNKEWYLKEFGEVEGLKRYNIKCENISSNCGHSLEKFSQRYGLELGQLKWDEYKNSCARNLEYFIKKYGKVNGKSKYKDFKKHIGKASNESLLVFNPLIKWLAELLGVNEIYYGSNDSREFFIVDNGKTYLYDLTIKSLKLIIEFNGIKFHVNENWGLERKENWRHPFKDISYGDSLLIDKFKIKLAEDNGFKVLTIWSDSPVEENIELCKEFILNNINT